MPNTMEIMPRRRAPGRIPVERLAEVSNVLFGEDRLGGPQIAERVGASHMNIWSWLNRRGMPEAIADQLAAVCDAHAHKLMRIAGQLRAAARDARAEMERAESDSE